MAIAVYISNVSYNKNHSKTAMDVSCPHCNKKFANKFSLASHKSRYHNKSRRKPERSTTAEHYNNVSADVKSESDKYGSDNEHQSYSENSETDEDQGSEDKPQNSNTKDTLAPSSDSETDFSTDESEDKSKTTLPSDGKKDVLASAYSENTSVSEDSDSKHKITTKRKLKKQMELPSKKRKAEKSVNDKATDLLAEIASIMFEEKHKKNSNQHLNLLESYELKHNVFSNLIGPIESKAIFLNDAIFADDLGTDTLSLVKASLETRSLREVNMLINENIDLVKKITTFLTEREKDMYV